MLGVLAWLGTSWALSWYQAAHESQLGLSYGPLLGLISTVACIWLMSLAFVMGAELNALLEHLGPSGKNPGGRRV